MIGADPLARVEPGRGLDVVLVRPPTLTAPRSLSYYGTVLPLGLAYVAAAVRRAGHRVRVVDAAGLSPDERAPYETPVGTLVRHGLSPAEIVDAVGPAPDVIGIGQTFLHEWGLARELVAGLRARHPDALIVAGGENASAFWADMLQQAPGLDACVRGEGEATFTTLLAALATGAPLQGIGGLALRRDGTPHATGPARRIDDLDALPRPAWDLFDVDAYLQRGLSWGVDRGRSMPLLTSRGCPYRCSFCSSPQMWTTRYRRRSVSAVLDELEDLIARHRIDNFDIADLTALLTRRWILELCDAIEARGLRLTFQLPSGTRSEAIDEATARRLVAAGCTNFCYAPESGSTRTLARIEKRVDPERLVASLRGAVRAGMKTHASLIVGFPHEQPADVLATARLAMVMALAGLHGVSMLAFAPYPGSAEYDALRRAGKLQIDDAYLYGSLLRGAAERTSYSPWLGARGLSVVQWTVMLAFFALQYARRPWRLGEVAVAAATGRQRTVLDQFLRTKLRQVREGLRGRLRWRSKSAATLPGAMPRKSLFSVVLATLVAAAPGCGGGDKKSDRADIKAAKANKGAGDDGANKKEAAPGKVFFVEPKDGATVPPKFSVEMGVEGKKVRPAGAVARNSAFGHHHILIDGNPIEDMVIVPKDETHLHYGTGVSKTKLMLDPGKHTLTLQFADGAHRSYGPDWSSTISVTVDPNAPAEDEDAAKPEGDPPKPEGDAKKPEGDAAKADADAAKADDDAKKPAADAKKPEADAKKADG